jgi:hypothetical protein
VVVSFPVGEADAEVGTYCALGCADIGKFPDADSYCAANVGRGNACQTVDLRAGDSGDFCVPATTTCEGYRAHDDDCSANEDICSVDGQGGGITDGTCHATDENHRCTYPCETAADCPGGYECGNDLAGHCDVT